MTPIQASSKQKESFVYQNLLDTRKKVKPKFQVNDLVGKANLKKTFSKSDSTNWSYKLYKVTDVIDDTIQSYETNQLPQGHKETLL